MNRHTNIWGPLCVELNNYVSERLGEDTDYSPTDTRVIYNTYRMNRPTSRDQNVRRLQKNLALQAMVNANVPEEHCRDVFEFLELRLKDLL